MKKKLVFEPKESQIERWIGDYLYMRDICFYKQNVQGFFKEGRFRKHANRYALTGLPDYVVIYKGFHLGLEVKTKTGKQSSSQKEFEAFLKLKGQADYHVVRSVDEARVAVDDFFKKVDRFYKQQEPNLS